MTRRLPRCLASLCFAAIVLIAFGCDNLNIEPAATIPVEGVVLTIQGAPVPAGSVFFEGVTGARTRAVGTLEGDGTFSLRTILGENRLINGVAEGLYRCTVLPANPDGTAQQIRLPQTYTFKKDMKLPIVILIRARAPGAQ